MHPRTIPLATVLALLLAPSAWAVYKVIGPDGHVTFTDIPPSRAGDQVKRIGIPTQTQHGQGASVIPTELAALVRQYPVVIYTTPQCPACDDGIGFLRARGVPYTDKTITTPADVTAYKGVSHGSEILPLLTVAGVQLRVGFDPGAWSQALTTAGYPQRSILPNDYRFAAPEPLAPTPGASRPGANKTDNTDGLPASPVQSPPNPKAPPGFQF
ncbi:MAG: glutaredoxin family protein [Proteobacteria bacterium]|nr:glutaredoxin family protein [Pseudomonadota bacterium]